jgi:hypothetical protein
MTDSTEASFPDGDGFGEVPGPDQTYNGGEDAWVVKVAPSGEGLVYAGYIGGDSYDAGFGMAIDADGSAYLGGMTFSSEATFPDGDGFGSLKGPDVTLNGPMDGFVAKVLPDGSGLEYVGYIGGDQHDLNYGIALGADESVYTAGFMQTGSAAFPAKGGPDLTPNDPEGCAPRDCADAWVAKLVPNPTDPDPMQNIVFGGFIGGSAWDHAFYIATDPTGAAYVVGDTTSSDATFPDGGGMASIPGARRSYNGGRDGWVVKVAPVGRIPPSPTDAATASATAPPPSPTPSATEVPQRLAYLPILGQTWR